MTPSRDIGRLIEVMAALRHPATGCPWDLEQTFATIAPYTIEEAYEVADAIARGDLDALRDEAGDLLLQAVYHARLAEEIGAFAFGDVVEAITAKMIRRHPHVFGGAAAANAEAVLRGWDTSKAKQREAKAGGRSSVLDDVPLALPALARAAKLQRRAKSIGFDWADPSEVLDKVREELGELEAEITAAAPDRIEDELGDLLFAIANLARHLKVDPEAALRRASLKFERRFRAVEAKLAAQAIPPETAGLALLDALWREAKADESGSAAPSPAA